MRQRNINYIRERIRTDFEDRHVLSDRTIEIFMEAAFALLEESEKSCVWCTHRRRMGFSQCRIHSHIIDDCSYRETDRHRFAKKNHNKIIVLAYERAHREGGAIDIIPREMERKIIFESAKLFELMEIENYMRDLEV